MEEDYLEDYAGFFDRLIALIIDSLIIGVGAGLIGGILAGTYFSTGIPDFIGNNGELNEIAVITAAVTYSGYALLVLIGSWLYYALQESSPRMATFGKRAMGIIVTDFDGNQISFGRATARYFGKLISKMVCYVGFIMAAFTERKQALHDVIANCLVLKDR